MPPPTSKPSGPTSAELARLATAIPGPKSRALAARLGEVESPDTTFLSEDYPVVWESASGSTVQDVDGNRYIDLNAGFGAAVIGHGHPRIRRVLKEQGEKLIHGMGDVHPSEVKVRLAEAIVRWAPGPGPWKVIFGVTGSDAVEAALKTAALATGKPATIAFRGGYHGLSLGTLSVTDGAKFRRGFEALIPRRAETLPYPADPAVAGNEEFESPERTLDRIDSLLSGGGGGASIGSVLIEPILGRGGVVPAPPGFMAQLLELCHRHGALLILDEIYTGFGRTGRWFACMHEPVIPDILVAGKALGGGLPISVCLARAQVMDAWEKSQGEARHTSTFLGHPLACACALETLDVLEGEDLPARAAHLGRWFAELLKAKLEGRSAVASIRGTGLMIGVELVEPRSGAPDPELAWSATVESLKSGVIVLVSGIHGNVLSLTPALTISKAQLEFGAKVIGRVIADLTARRAS